MSNEFKCALMLAEMRSRGVDVASCVAKMESTKSHELARVVLGVVRLQRHIDDRVRRTLECLPPGSLRTIIERLCGPFPRVAAELLDSTATCCVLGVPGQCANLKIDGDTFVVARHVLTPLLRCYAFVHVIEKLTQHRHAREDPQAYEIWREDERQMRLLHEPYASRDDT